MMIMSNIQTFTRWIDPTIEEQKKEIDRLNNVINELEKWLIEYRTFIDIPDYYEEGIIDCLDEVLDKLKELKEKNNGNLY